MKKVSLKSFRFILAFAVSMLMTPSTFGQTESPLELEDEDAAFLEEGGEVSDEEADWSELDQSFEEIKQDRVGSVDVGVGTNEAWQDYHISMSWISSLYIDWVMQAGYASREFNGSRTSRDYQINAKAKALGGSFRYFFTALTTFYYRASLGYAFISGDISPMGQGSEDESESAVTSLQSGFNANGPWISQQVGWLHLWESGCFLDISLLGVEKTFLVSKNFTQNSGEAKAAVLDSLQRPKLWGFINLSFGYYF